MKPKELLERLRILSISGKATDSAFSAPHLCGEAAQLIALRSANKYTQLHGPSSVTCQDLREFLDWLTPLIAASYNES